MNIVVVVVFVVVVVVVIVVVAVVVVVVVVVLLSKAIFYTVMDNLVSYVGWLLSYLAPLPLCMTWWLSYLGIYVVHVAL